MSSYETLVPMIQSAAYLHISRTLKPEKKKRDKLQTNTRYSIQYSVHIIPYQSTRHSSPPKNGTAPNIY